MTGEVTLRGRVLPVGGIREKALAALRAGIRTMILPEKNLVDLREVPPEFARRIRFIGVSSMDEVLAIALERAPVQEPRRNPRRTPLRSARPAPAASAKPTG
jgi:ATP-dependent Lon protease